jgi:hypothetical protein
MLIMYPVDLQVVTQGPESKATREILAKSKGLPRSSRWVSSWALKPRLWCTHAGGCSRPHTERQFTGSLGQILVGSSEFKDREFGRLVTGWRTRQCGHCPFEDTGPLVEGRDVRECRPCPCLPVSERGADLGSLWIKVKICSVGQMVRER